MNERSLQETLKALQALDSGVINDLIPEKIDPIIAELADLYCPLRSRLARKEWHVLNYTWDERTVLPKGGCYNESHGWGQPSPAFDPVNTKPVKRFEQIKMFKAEESITNLLKTVTGDVIDARRYAILGATKTYAQNEENLLINGDASVTDYEWNGLQKQISSNAGSVIDAAGAVINFDLLDEGIQGIIDAGGKPDLILAVGRDWIKLSNIQRSQGYWVFGNSGQTNIKSGVRITDYLGVPFETSAFMPKTLGPYSNYSRLYILDSSEIFVAWSLGPTPEDVKTDKDAQLIRVKGYQTLVVRSRTKQRVIENIGKP